MNLRRRLACLSILLLLLLLLLQFETPCYAGVDDKLNRFKAGSGGGLSPNFQSQGQGKVGGGGDGIFGAEKRKVYTGPNPLHNR